MAIAMTCVDLTILDVGDPCFSFSGAFSQKMKKIHSFIFSFIHLTSSFSCVAVSNTSLRVKVFENDGDIWNY